MKPRNVNHPAVAKTYRSYGRPGSGVTRRNTTGFGLELNKQMVSRGLRAPALAKMVGVSVQMVHKLLRGQKNIAPGLLARFAKTLEWSDDDRRRIHQIAARDHGFRI